MNRRDRAIMIFAMLLSVVFHVGLAMLVMNVTLSMANRPLFASVSQAEVTQLDIERDPQDFFEDDPVRKLLDPELSQRENAEKLAQATRELVNRTEPSSLPTPDAAPTPQDLAKPSNPNIDTSALTPRPLESTGPGSLDTTARLLALAKPEIELPQFNNTSDLLAAPVVDVPEEALASRLDLRALNQLQTGGSPGGDGVAAPDRGDGTGTAADKPSPALPPSVAIVLPPAPKPRSVSPAEPPLPLPAPTPGAPSVTVDEAFEYSLYTHVDRESSSPGFRGLEPNEVSTPHPGYLEVRIQPNSKLRQVRNLHKDVVYLVDTSESITPRWIAEVKKGLSSALESLNPGDRFNIVMFKDQVAVFSPDELAPVIPENIEAARRFITQADASGTTDINLALGKLLVRTMPNDRVYQIVLLSDGTPTRGTIDARSIINLITRENDHVAGIYCIGIGNQPNRELLQYLAYRNKGYVVYPGEAVRVAAVIADTASRLRYPVIKDATFNVAGVDDSLLYPQIRRDIYQSDPVSLFGRFPVGADRLSMRVVGVSGPSNLDFTFVLRFAEARDGGEQVMSNWAFWRLHHLYNQTFLQRDNKELERRVNTLKKQYKLKVDY